MTWPCGHTTSIAYAHWPSCPVCAMENGNFTAIMRMLKQLDTEKNERSMRETIAESRAFNRRGCPHCGAIS